MCSAYLLKRRLTSETLRILASLKTAQTIKETSYNPMNIQHLDERVPTNPLTCALAVVIRHGLILISRHKGNISLVNIAQLHLYYEWMSGPARSGQFDCRSTFWPSTTSGCRLNSPPFYISITYVNVPCSQILALFVVPLRDPWLAALPLLACGQCETSKLIEPFY